MQGSKEGDDYISGRVNWRKVRTERESLLLLPGIPIRNYDERRGKTTGAWQSAGPTHRSPPPPAVALSSFTLD